MEKHAKLFKNLRLHYCVIETGSIENISAEKFMPKLKIGFGWYVAEGTWYKNVLFCPAMECHASNNIF